MSTTTVRKRIGGGYKFVKVNDAKNDNGHEENDVFLEADEISDIEKNDQSKYKSRKESRVRSSNRNKQFSNSEDGLKLPHINSKNSSLVSSISSDPLESDTDLEKQDFGTEKGDSYMTDENSEHLPSLDITRDTSTLNGATFSSGVSNGKVSETNCVDIL